MLDFISFDRLADVLSYPRDGYAAGVAMCRAALAVRAPQAADDIASFEHATAAMTVGALQELYTSTFDLNPHSTLDVGWHVFGERYDRGAFLATLRADLRAAGVPETSELPDHLTHLLRLIGRSTPVHAAELGALAALALERTTPLLESDHNPYAFLLRAVRTTLAAIPPVGPTFRSGARPALRSGDHEA